MKNYNRIKPTYTQRNEENHNGKYVVKYKIFFFIFKFL